MTVKKPQKPIKRAPASAPNSGTFALLWGEKDAGSRGPKPGLSLERIARAAIGIADAEGLAAVSMQRVAAEFGFTTMSLYRYVPGKAELVDVMFDVGMGDPPALDQTPGGWRGKLVEWALRISDLISLHPWSLDVLNRLRVMGPNELAWLEAALGAFSDTGLTGEEALDAVFLLVGHVRMVAQYSVELPPEQRSLTTQAWGATMEEIASKHGHAYPAFLAATMGGGFGTTNPQGVNFGLERILDGIGLLIEKRAGRQRP